MKIVLIIIAIAALVFGGVYSYNQGWLTLKNNQPTETDKELVEAEKRLKVLEVEAKNVEKARHNLEASHANLKLAKEMEKEKVSISVSTSTSAPSLSTSPVVNNVMVAPGGTLILGEKPKAKSSQGSKKPTDPLSKEDREALDLVKAKKREAESQSRTGQIVQDPGFSRGVNPAMYSGGGQPTQQWSQPPIPPAPVQPPQYSGQDQPGGVSTRNGTIGIMVDGHKVQWPVQAGQQIPQLQWIIEKVRADRQRNPRGQSGGQQGQWRNNHQSEFYSSGREW